ncbi:hypothetical protein LPPLD21_02074 [Lactiplantibacillus paraplantarum]|uniref:Uncharacterized protein n=1 Tax=Lactiplantibacillus paraplantarum TaxID=60520 RepID=A0ABQ0NBZ1_9LACO|nr:hypothetical protein LPPLD21_02074 [Lactiplantibacillus paraplantarum]
MIVFIGQKIATKPINYINFDKNMRFISVFEQFGL